MGTQTTPDQFYLPAGGEITNATLFGDTISLVQALLTDITFNAKSRDYGALGDGSTNDATAIQAAITAAKAATTGSAVGASVLLPGGTYIVNSQIVVPKKVVLRGVGRGGSIIKAGATFPADTALVKLGDTTGSPPYAGGARLEDLGVNCNYVTGSVGIYSEEIQEAGGVFRCQVTNYGDAGIRLKSNTTTPQNVVLYDTEVDGGTQNINLTTYYTSAAYDINCTGGYVLLLKCTANSGDAVVGPRGGFQLRGSGSVELLACHAEGFTDGILFGVYDAGGTTVDATGIGGGIVSGYKGHNTKVINQVRIGTSLTAPIVLLGLKVGTLSPGSYLILDDTNSNAMDNPSCAMYVLGGTGTNRDVFTTEGPTTWNKRQSPHQFLGATALQRLTTRTGDYSISATADCVVPFSASGGARVATLPQASATRNGQTFIIKKTDTSANAVTINCGNNTDTIDNITGTPATTSLAGGAAHCIILVSNGSSRFDIVSSF